MKKTFIPMLTLSLMLGVASSGFAAANPFTDVPKDHWSFDAVQKLAQSGVIEGYGDDTFRGDAHITRYEMATMVARAMAKESTSGSDKAVIDQLAKEYADELQNLGVRVTDLEKKSDNVQFSGTLKLESARSEYDGVKDSTESLATLELDITATVNDEWAVKGVIEAESDLKSDSSAETTLTQAYAEGKLFGAQAKLGKFGTFDAESLSAGGMIIDTEVSGAEFTFGDKLSTILTIGRLNADEYSLTENFDASDYQALQFVYQANDKLALDAGYYHIKNSGAFIDGDSFADKNGIWSVGADYQIAPELILGGAYAVSSLTSAPELSGNSEKAYSVQLTYKGTESEIPHSYGLWAAYRKLGELATIAPTYDGADVDQKGFEIGVDYMIAKNILGKVVYFDGEEINSGNDVKKIFGQLEFSF